ncbi:hypothetical protein BH23DEI1_BH23DEI1_10320 [soil metagenome]
MSSTAPRRLTLHLTILALAFGLAAAQTHVTGSVDTVIDGRTHTFGTSATRIADDAGAGVENAAARAMLERLAGTTQHTATWLVMEPIVMGGVVMFAAEDMFISITAYGEERSQFSLEFGLVLETLELSDPDDVEILVKYFPERWGTSDFYALTEGALVIDLVERVDATTLRIRGSFSGTLSFQEQYTVAHNPADTRSIAGTFDILEVGGSSALDMVLGATD